MLKRLKMKLKRFYVWYLNLKLPKNIKVWILDKAHHYINYVRECKYCNYDFRVDDIIVTKCGSKKHKHYCLGCAKLVRLI